MIQIYILDFTLINIDIVLCISFMLEVFVQVNNLDFSFILRF